MMNIENKKLKTLDNSFYRDLSYEINRFSTLQKGVAASINNEDWELKLNGEYNNLSLSSNCTSIDMSNASISDITKLNQQDVILNALPTKERFIIKNSLVISSDFIKKTASVRVAEMVRFNYETNTPYKFRTIIQYNPQVSEINFSQYFAHFISDKTERMCISTTNNKTCNNVNGIAFSHRNVNFLVYNYAQDINDQRRYLVIESLEPIKYDDYITASNEILHIIGFFTTTYPLGPYLIFDIFDNPEVSSSFFAYKDCLGKPLVAKYFMLTMNPYEYYLNDDIRNISFNKKGLQIKPLSVENKPKPIEKRHFEKMLSLLTDKNFSNMFFSLQQASTTTLGGSFFNHIVTLIIYAACLESIAKWFERSVTKDTLQKTALLSKASRETLTGEFIKILQEKCKDENQEDVSKVKNKIKGALFQKPNADNLTEPFKHYNVELSKDDEELLKLRNKILHGNDILNNLTFDCNNVIPFVNEVEKKCFGFYSLIWRLLMKIIDYSGIYRDVASLNEKFRNNQSNNGEPLFKQI